MSAAPVAALAIGQDSRAEALVRNRVLLLLWLAALVAALVLAFVSVAPNRLTTGVGVPLRDLVSGRTGWLWLPAVLLLVAVFAPTSCWNHAGVAITASMLLAGLAWFAGREAVVQSGLSSLARVSVGGGFWILMLLAWLAAADALQRLGLALAWRSVAHAAVWLPLLGLLLSGGLDGLSLLKEYDNRQNVFNAAGLRHLQIVAATLLPALLIGLPLGVAAARTPAFARPLFGVLNIIQTVPSIALFALLIAPLAALAETLPGWGIQGIGLLPAVIALALYALLPIVHGTASGLAQVP
ncbi:MAG TPA: ABC transporter permease subunit, partial [Burkholderiaceae bacterium]